MATLASPPLCGRAYARRHGPQRRLRPAAGGPGAGRPARFRSRPRTREPAGLWTWCRIAPRGPAMRRFSPDRWSTIERTSPRLRREHRAKDSSTSPPPLAAPDGRAPIGSRRLSPGIDGSLGPPRCPTRRRLPGEDPARASRSVREQCVDALPESRAGGWCRPNRRERASSRSGVPRIRRGARSQGALRPREPSRPAKRAVGPSTTSTQRSKAPHFR